MATLIESPQSIQPAGDKPKRIDEFFGRASDGNQQVSIAKMQAPAGWTEPGQRPDFDEYTLVLSGMLMVKTRDRQYKVQKDQAILVRNNEWVQYSTPAEQGAHYLSVCLPAFSEEIVHRDNSE